MERRFLKVCACLIALAATARMVGAELVRAQDFVLTDEQFNAWLTNGQDSALERIEAQMTVQIRSLTQICSLTPAQVQKLELAARGDIERFQARVQEVHDRLVGKTYDQNEINTVWQQIQPLQQELPLVLGPGSLFSRVMHSTLREGQRADYERAKAERDQYRYAAKVRLFVAALEQGSPLTDKQREELVDFLLESTRRPQRFGEYDWYYVMVQASQAPAERLEEILNETQLLALRQAFQQAEPYAQMLQQQGIVPVEEPPPAADEPADEPAEAAAEVAAAEENAS
jgi:hypothetical protein